MKALSKDQTPEVSGLPTINENALVPRGSFIIPKSYVQGLMTSHLEGLEARLVKEVGRLEMWVFNLETQLDAAHTEIEKLVEENRKLKGLDKAKE